ncbi:hypothetical protein [Nostoc sp. CHAB 5715]|uniref:hypothetical protein n=1 Tax=Nostoc sp. CHAB 5715 TaxID=2780400 RepID=UPI001E413F3E|nr:hypothetical protein [Nostoc sp. CHAB 5715]MCC5622728.1 hypothetical protein [Nostoc sp. CHAB 5715]
MKNFETASHTHRANTSIDPTLTHVTLTIFQKPLVSIRPSSAAPSPQGSNRRLWRGGWEQGQGKAIAYGRRTFTKILYRVIHINRVYKFTTIIFYQHSVYTLVKIYTYTQVLQISPIAIA